MPPQNAANNPQESPVPVPGATPNAVSLAQLLAKLFTPPQAATGAPGGTGAVVGQGAPALAGAPQVPGVTSPVPTGSTGVGTGIPVSAMSTKAPSSAPPSVSVPNNFPNAQAKMGGIVSAGVENFAQAIHSMKTQKDADELAKAKNTMEIYQKASQIDPSTGAPVDPYTKNLYESDPKIVKSWEKMLKLEFPRLPPDPGAPVGKGGKPAQGKPIIPTPQPSPQDQLTTLLAQQKLKQAQGGATAPGELTNDEKHDAALIAAGIKPAAKDQKDLDHLQAQIDEQEALAAEHKGDLAKINAELQAMPVEEWNKNNAAYQDLLTKRAEAQRDIAEALKDGRDLTQAKTLVQFTTVRKGLDTVVADASRDLARLQSTANTDRGTLRKTFGLNAADDPNIDSKQAELLARRDMVANYNNLQDDVLAGKISAVGAMTQARRSANLTTDYKVWGGVPKDAPDAKDFPDGSGLPGPNGPLAVVEKGKWVAP